MIGLDQTARVLGANPGSGAHDVVLVAALPCRLLTAPPVGAMPPAERDELLSRHRLLWGPTTTIPETAQILLAGQRWAMRAGTADAVRGPDGAVVYQRCDVVRAI